MRARAFGSPPDAAAKTSRALPNGYQRIVVGLPAQAAPSSIWVATEWWPIWGALIRTPAPSWRPAQIHDVLHTPGGAAPMFRQRRHVHVVRAWPRKPALGEPAEGFCPLPFRNGDTDHLAFGVDAADRGDSSIGDGRRSARTSKAPRRRARARPGGAAPTIADRRRSGHGSPRCRSDRRSPRRSCGHRRPRP